MQIFLSLVMLDACSMANKAVILSLVGGTVIRQCREGLMSLLQHVDVLFITEIECRRLALIFTYRPGMTLEEVSRLLVRHMIYPMC